MLEKKREREKKRIMELNMDVDLVYVPEPVSEFLKQASKIKNGFQRLCKISDYVRRLEDEMKKIDAFRRELPLCMLLLKDVIKRLKEEEMMCKELGDGSVTIDEGNGKVNKENDGGPGDKRNWMSTVQLWNSDSDNVDQNKKPNKVPVLKLRSEEEQEQEQDLFEDPIEFFNNKRFKGQMDKENLELSLMTPSFDLGSSSPSHNPILKINDNCKTGFGSDQNQTKFQTKHQQDMQNCKKQRRCWSPELHKRFVEALQKLGGSKVATPKQIRELMQVDGLTNDEVKSHLQKYRLHFRKVASDSAAQNQCNEKMKANISEPDSPQGPLRAGGWAKGLSSGGSVVEGEDDEKSDGRSWRSGGTKTGEIEH
ncbi:hypothetical protein Gohar_018212 [Gossypium harknessii]|uniref:HTH myb-type domain-containing protein n=1 Tax=Gossypium harknessii TaxID=34285 RepID=A0A7J9G8D3_9ROSI|nr:hypothetical protein [Gossypium harknessii]